MVGIFLLLNINILAEFVSRHLDVLCCHKFIIMINFSYINIIHIVFTTNAPEYSSRLFP